MFTLRQYLLTLSDPDGLTRTLGRIEVCRDERGRPLFSAGNSAAVFRIRHEGRLRALRCYLRPVRHLREIYGERLLERELYLHTSPCTGEWVDVVLCDWIEGETLHEAVCQAATAADRTRLEALSEAFDRLAARLVADNAAHGDLKPENIVVAPDGTLHPIDLDATFLPQFAGELSPELGTAAFQHPARTAADFDASLDDFPAALIATALHALRLDPAFYTRHRLADGLLFSPRNIMHDEALNEALALFERTGRASWYRIARLLRSPVLRLFRLPELFACTVREQALPKAATVNPAPTDVTAQPPEAFVRDGLWGYRSGERTVIPPLYDCAFDFSEGLAAVQLGRTWHFIDTQGRTRLSCPGCEAVKPFRRGRAQLFRNGRRTQIDPAGREFEY